MRDRKKIDLGFVILSPEHNIGKVQTTFRSIRNRYGLVPIICVVDGKTTASELKELRGVCPTYKGKGTITSLLNLGLSKGHSGWNMFAMEGSIVRANLDQKFGYWADGEENVLYPIVTDYNRDGVPIKIYNEFEECTLNGLCIHSEFFKKVGDFSDNPLDVSRRFWALEAAGFEVKFKGILGAKFC